MLRHLFKTGECEIQIHNEEMFSHVIFNIVLRGMDYIVTEINTEPDWYERPNIKKIELKDKQKGIEAYEYMEKYKFGEVGLGEIQVGYIFEKINGENQGSRYMVMAIERVETRSRKSVVAVLVNGDKLNINEYENQNYRYVGRLSFEELNPQ